MILWRKRSFVLFAIFLLSSGAAMRAEDWPQWRGPNRDGVWSETGILQSNNDNIPSPVWQKNRLLVSGLMFELDAHRPSASVLWPETRAVAKRLLSNTSTAILQGNHVFSARSSGELVCLDA